MRERHKIKGLNSPRLCVLTIFLVKVKFYRPMWLFCLYNPPIYNTQQSSMFVVTYEKILHEITTLFAKVIWLWAILHRCFSFVTHALFSCLPRGLLLICAGADRRWGRSGGRDAVQSPVEEMASPEAS